MIRNLVLVAVAAVTLGAVLGCATASQIEETYMDDSRTEYFTRAEGTIGYDDTRGDGELVIMLPGMGALRSEYRFLAPILADAGYRVVTADLRGHGDSSADWDEYTVPASGRDILALIEHLDTGPAHVIGTSFSPGAAVWAAAEDPSAIRSLTLIGAFVRDPDTSFMGNLLFGILTHGPWKVGAWGSFYGSLYPTAKPDDFDQYIDDLKASLREPGRYQALRKLAATPRIESEERQRQLE